MKTTKWQRGKWTWNYVGGIPYPVLMAPAREVTDPYHVKATAIDGGPWVLVPAGELRDEPFARTRQIGWCAVSPLWDGNGVALTSPVFRSKAEAEHWAQDQTRYVLALVAALRDSHAVGVVHS